MMTSTRPVVLLALWFLVAGVAAQPAQGQTFTVLYNFTGGTDGGQPWGAVIQDSSGNLYGTAQSGGNGYGVVYEINTAGSETALYTFGGYPSDGESPITPLLRDGEGNLYGTTAEGSSADDGTVFKIDPAGEETILHTFIGSDGAIPFQGLAMGKSGILFGTTSLGGSDNRGTIFKVEGPGKFTLLHNMVGTKGGRSFDGHLTMDNSGNLYGASAGGGGHWVGLVYELTTAGTFVVVHSFKKAISNGCYPIGSVVLDEAGNLYGATTGCGSYGYGTIWKLSKDGNETTLHNFADDPSDGCKPYGSVARDPKGNKYGVTSACGAYGYGALYELTTNNTFVLLHSFDMSDGVLPLGEVLWTAGGTLFGTAENGGAYGQGTVWSYVP